MLGTHTYVRLCVPLHEHEHTHTLSMLLLTVLTLFFIDLSLLIVHRLIALSLLHCELPPEAVPSCHKIPHGPTGK